VNIVLPTQNSTKPICTSQSSLCPSHHITELSFSPGDYSRHYGIGDASMVSLGEVERHFSIGPHTVPNTFRQLLRNKEIVQVDDVCNSGSFVHIVRRDIGQSMPRHNSSKLWEVTGHRWLNYPRCVLVKVDLGSIQRLPV